MANAIVGTLELVLLACLMGVPMGVGAGLFLAENRGNRLSDWVRFAADVMMGVPSIVVGIFAYAVVVRPMGGFSTIVGRRRPRDDHDSNGHPQHRRNGVAGAA